MAGVTSITQAIKILEASGGRRVALLRRRHMILWIVEHPGHRVVVAEELELMQRFGAAHRLAEHRRDRAVEVGAAGARAARAAAHVA